MEGLADLTENFLGPPFLPDLSYPTSHSLPICPPPLPTDWPEMLLLQTPCTSHSHDPMIPPPQSPSWPH